MRQGESVKVLIGKELARVATRAIALIVKQVSAPLRGGAHCGIVASEPTIIRAIEATPLQADESSDSVGDVADVDLLYRAQVL